MKGFTLLEILVTILIFTFIIGGMYGVLNISRTNYDTNLVSLNLQRQIRQGMSRLIREIRQGSFSSFSSDGNNYLTFNTTQATGVKYFVGNTTVSGNTYWYLKREYPTGTNITIANDISYMNVTTGTGMHTKKITLNASKTFYSGWRTRNLTFNLTGQAEVRNP